MAEQAKPVIGFLGTGLMGYPMAGRLLDAGFRVSVWNRSAAKAAGLAARGARLARVPAEAAEGADLVFTMLFDGGSTGEVLFEQGAAAAMRKAAIVVDTGSSTPGTAREHRRRLSERGVSHLDAPVSGGVQGAQAGTLAIMAGGEPLAFEAALPALRVLGKSVLVGPSGSGQLAKLANQAIVGITICAVAEALALVEAGGADPARLREALAGGFADSPILRQHGGRMLRRDWTPGGPIRAHVKDFRNILGEAASLGLDLPMTAECAALFEAASADGLADYDHSALKLEIERRNGGVKGQ